MLFALKVRNIKADLIIKKLPYDLSSHAGLAFVDKYPKRIHLNAPVDPAFPVRSGGANSEILKSYLALLCLGKNDFDAIENFHSDAFIIKWNPRRTPVETIAALRVADASTQWVFDRLDKRECIWQESLELAGVGSTAHPARRVYRLIERTIVDLGFCDKRGVVLLSPEYVPKGWTTTLPQRVSPAEIIALHFDHATRKQFGKTPSQHWEVKSDMDLERQPSGKFDINYQVCQLAAAAINLLRLIGQNTLNEPDAPIRHTAKHQRTKTVMQELIFKAARMIKHAGRWILGWGESDSGFAVFERHYGRPERLRRRYHDIFLEHLRI